MSTDDPVNEMDRIEGIQIIVEVCVICGDTHYHGTGGELPAVGDETHRVAHCGGEIGTGYHLVRTEGTEVLGRQGRVVDND